MARDRVADGRRGAVVELPVADTAPEANYAVFGSAESPLTADSVTFTIDTLHGGGAALCAVQLVGEAGAGVSFKTAVPVPVPTPAFSIDTGPMLSASGLEDDVIYQLQASGDP